MTWKWEYWQFLCARIPLAHRTIASPDPLTPAQDRVMMLWIVMGTQSLTA